MVDMPKKGLSVYRLLPSLTERQTLRLNSFDHRRIMHWQRTGDEADRPTCLRADWLSEPLWATSDFPSGHPSAPVLSRRVAESFGDDLLNAGRLLPVEVENSRDDDEYVLYLVE